MTTADFDGYKNSVECLFLRCKKNLSEGLREACGPTIARSLFYVITQEFHLVTGDFHYTEGEKHYEAVEEEHKWLFTEPTNPLHDLAKQVIEMVVSRRNEKLQKGI